MASDLVEVVQLTLLGRVRGLCQPTAATGHRAYHMLFEFFLRPPLKVRLVLQRRLREGQAIAAKELLGRGGVPHVNIFSGGFRALGEGGLFLHV